VSAGNFEEKPVQDQHTKEPSIGCTSIKGRANDMDIYMCANAT
jgi:hypothetical protein